MTSKLNVVNLQMLHAAAELAAPAVALQHGSVQLAVTLRLEVWSANMRGGKTSLINSTTTGDDCALRGDSGWAMLLATTYSLGAVSYGKLSARSLSAWSCNRSGGRAGDFRHSPTEPQ